MNLLCPHYSIPVAILAVAVLYLITACHFEFAVTFLSYLLSCVAFTSLYLRSLIHLSSDLHIIITFTLLNTHFAAYFSLWFSRCVKR
jgi:hypothetical protein